MGQLVVRDAEEDTEVDMLRKMDTRWNHLVLFAHIRNNSFG